MKLVGGNETETGAGVIRYQIASHASGYNLDKFSEWI